MDKIVIDEHGAKAFVNGILPGAYKSVSSVDFEALDKHRLQLIGIYGSKTEIARFLLASGNIDQETCVLLSRTLLVHVFIPRQRGRYAGAAYTAARSADQTIFALRPLSAP